MATTTSDFTEAEHPRDEDGQFKPKRATGNGRRKTAQSTQPRQTKTQPQRRGKQSSASTGALLGAAAAGVAVGVAAMFGRKFAVQAPTALAGDWDQALKAEHEATLTVFDKLEASDSTQTTKRTMLLAHLKHALGKHAFQEENTVYPMLRDNGQTEEADELNGEHGYVKQYLHDLEMMPKDSPMFLSKLADFRRDIEDHMRDEEGRIFPALKAKLSAEENKKLTVAMNKEGLKLA